MAISPPPPTDSKEQALLDFTSALRVHPGIDMDHYVVGSLRTSVSLNDPGFTRTVSYTWQEAWEAPGSENGWELISITKSFFVGHDYSKREGKHGGTTIRG